MKLRGRIVLAMCVALGLAVAALAQQSPDSGLLFYLSADHGLTADFARGAAVPNIADAIPLADGGASGHYIQQGDEQMVSWKAPGNVYAQRGTLSLFWRPRTPLGRNQFTIFRVGYADHTSWDMVWLRLDYNGHGFDAFVTDNNLARVRVSFSIPDLPRPDEWVHLAVAWDETVGIRLYVNGVLAAQKDQNAVLDAGLDQFGPNGRVISPMQVQSLYQYTRASDIDEVRFYDHMLSDANIAALARKQEVAADPGPVRDLSQTRWRDEWWQRYGWNRAGDPPVGLSAPSTAIRKVEFREARDLKERINLANDGIAETTWPGVYNRSLLPGRHDYFELPDWNVYVEGGKSITFTLPDEDWNHLEFTGAAFGRLVALSGKGEKVLATRPRGQERTYYQFAGLHGGMLWFDNDVQETPIQELAAYNIVPGAPPADAPHLDYTVRVDADPAAYAALDELGAYIKGREPADEAAMLVALPGGAPSTSRPALKPGLPLFHILIPADFRKAKAGDPLGHFSYGWEGSETGLDGIVIDLPALSAKPTHGAFIPLNIQIKDPIWPARDLLDINVSVRPGEARTIWLDTRDRLLPEKSLYLTIASASGDVTAASLNGMHIRLVLKPRAATLAEHIADRFAQMRDNFAFFVEEHSNDKRLARFARFAADIKDLFRADPDNKVARQYWLEQDPQEPHLPFAQPQAPAGVPLWAFRQVTELKLVRQFVTWWIDNRQVGYGDFGGGISDDDDLTQQWPGLALMGDETGKVRHSLDALADAVDKNGMITNGLGTIKTDYLHSYEEGLNARSEDAYLADGNPKAIERLMQTGRAYPRITEVNKAGHTHFISQLFSGTEVVRENVWGWSHPYSPLILHPGVALVNFNNNPVARKMILDLADGYIEHGKQAAGGRWNFPELIHSEDDAEKGILKANTRGISAMLQLFWAAYDWTGDAKYLRPVESAIADGDHADLTYLNADVIARLGKQDSWGRDIVALTDKQEMSGVPSPARDDGPTALNFNRFVSWQMTGDKHYLENLYADEIQTDSQRLPLVTEGHWWSDRVELFSDLLQRSRLGGMALRRNQLFPGNLVSWRFAGARTAEGIAILIRGGLPGHFKVIAFNLTSAPIKAEMIGAMLKPGLWRMQSGIDSNNDDNSDGPVAAKNITLEKGLAVPLTFAPHKTSIIEFTLEKEMPPVAARPDLGMGAEDVRVTASGMDVTIHSLGAMAAPPATLLLEDASGKVTARVPVPGLAAPADLLPKTVMVHLPAAPRHGRLVLATTGAEITGGNNSLSLP